MADTNVQPEKYDSLQIRRRAARQALGWSDADSEENSSDHIRTCQLLEEGGFFPDRRLASFAGLTCGTGQICVYVSLDTDAELATAELDHFSRRYFFLDPDDRLNHWTQLIEVVAPYPALAWRHSRLRNGLQIPRDVLRPLSDRVDLAAALIDWSLQSPRLAAAGVRRFIFDATESSISVHRMWQEWYDIQLKTTLFQLSTPANIASLRYRIEQTAANRTIQDIDVIVEARAEARKSREGLTSLVSRSLWITLGVLFYLSFGSVALWDRVSTFFEKDRGKPEIPAATPSFNKSVIFSPSRDLTQKEKVPGTVAERDKIRGELILSLLRNAEIMRANDGTGKIGAQYVVSIQIDQAVESLNDVTLLHSLADTINKRQDGTMRDVGLILSRSDLSFQCIGYGRLDEKSRISHAVWVNAREPVTAETASAIEDQLNGEPLLEDDQRSALAMDLKLITELEVMVLTPAEFLATFKQSIPVNGDAQASPKSSTELPLDSNPPQD